MVVSDIPDVIIHSSFYQKSKLLTSGFADELEKSNSSFHIKNYGPGNLQTVTVRGSNAEQTNVFWEGVPINSKLNGLTDFGKYGSISQKISLDDSKGGIGGSVSMDALVPKETAVDLSTRLAYFGNESYQTCSF